MIWRTQNQMKGRRGWSMQMISISEHLDDTGERNDFWRTGKIKLHNRFRIQKPFCKNGVFSEYCFVPRVIIRNACQQPLEFIRCKIVVCRECGLLFIVCHSGRNPTFMMQIWNQGVAEDLNPFLWLIPEKTDVLWSLCKTIQPHHVWLSRNWHICSTPRIHSGSSVACQQGSHY